MTAGYALGRSRGTSTLIQIFHTLAELRRSGRMAHLQTALLVFRQSTVLLRTSRKQKAQQ